MNFQYMASVGSRFGSVSKWKVGSRSELDKTLKYKHAKIIQILMKQRPDLANYA
jgi:hypothetical protein